MKAEKSELGDDFTTVQARAGRGARYFERALGGRRCAGARAARWLWAEGLFSSKLVSGKDENNADHAKFRDYFDYDEPVGRVPSHRALAVFRGRALEILDAKLVLPEPPLPAGAVPPKGPVVSLAEGKIALHLGWSHKARPADD